ncbi:divalent-cation tolerance protein CutA [Shewanella gelidii]|uniref:Divalent-cation tolerance protein CutA n=1 Tax=Shewanella gelidii TaxID=1642821 RepID=A0A917JQG1_9GAMM|nr:divalent-cation tolerance protein CutA [Shewanella gelidii]MCL1097631.1 divalent-cation tolerance protein CutA [Shewanella gelidii]GGI80074.1 divalent-cation tolerance protein CutA [Shewanella gelidii]
MQPEYLMVITTCPDHDCAQRIASALVQAKLAACVQIVSPVTSVYHWQEQVCQETEYPLHIKCQAKHYQQLQQELQNLHPYEVPQIVAVPLTYGLPAYFDWIKDTTQP